MRFTSPISAAWSTHLSGLPAFAGKFNVVRTSESERNGPLAAQSHGGGVQMDLPAHSLTTLTTMVPDYLDERISRHRLITVRIMPDHASAMVSALSDTYGSVPPRSLINSWRSMRYRYRTRSGLARLMLAK